MEWKQNLYHSEASSVCLLRRFTIYDSIFSLARHLQSVCSYALVPSLRSTRKNNKSSSIPILLSAAVISLHSRRSDDISPLLQLVDCWGGVVFECECECESV
mmetsp:Transcript_10796/g.23035  ORF Transcript_10796/g.23035 Transcript_10796/m.23035 type:complete len:102 (-) Transcript_10796:61-366(-)